MADTKNPKKTATPGATPAQAEAEKATHTIVDVSDEYPSVDPFAVPIDRNDWPMSVSLALERGRDMMALQGIMGPLAFAQFAATDPTHRQAIDLLNRVAGAVGLADAGESGGSSGS